MSDVVFPCQCLDCGAGISLAFCNAIASHLHSSLQTTSCNCSSALSQILCCHPTPSTTPAAATLSADDFLRVVAGRIPGWKDYNTLQQSWRLRLRMALQGVVRRLDIGENKDRKCDDEMWIQNEAAIPFLPSLRLSWNIPSFTCDPQHIAQYAVEIVPCSWLYELLLFLVSFQKKAACFAIFQSIWKLCKNVSMPAQTHTEALTLPF